MYVNLGFKFDSSLDNRHHAFYLSQGHHTAMKRIPRLYPLPASSSIMRP